MSLWSRSSREALRERHRQQEGEQDLHAGQRDAHSFRSSISSGCAPRGSPPARAETIDRRARPRRRCRTSAGDLQLASDAGEDLRDAGLADAEHAAGLRPGELLDVDEREDLALTLGQLRDCGPHRRPAVGAQHRRSGFVLPGRRLMVSPTSTIPASSAARAGAFTSEVRASSPRGSCAACRGGAQLGGELLVARNYPWRA